MPIDYISEDRETFVALTRFVYASLECSKLNSGGPWVDDKLSMGG
jgi:hypothetical protein